YKKEKSGVPALLSRESETPLHFVYWFVIQYFGTMRIDRYCILWYDCRVCCVNIVEEGNHHAVHR
ncbi:MAG: hypothetical protein SPF43_05155, partial [Bacteroidales bacterium]|nr:hypothetical protein [Bacteroidales bacterium]